MLTCKNELSGFLFRTEKAKRQWDGRQLVMWPTESVRQSKINSSQSHSYDKSQGVGGDEGHSPVLRDFGLQYPF